MERTVILSTESRRPSVFLKCCQTQKDVFHKLQKLFSRKYHSLLKNKKLKSYACILIIFFILYFWLIFIKIPEVRENEAVWVTMKIKQSLGTRLTAVRLLPDVDTTVWEPPGLAHCRWKTHAVILVQSSPENFDRRNALRETWFKYIRNSTYVISAYFFIEKPKTIAPLNDESLEHGDIIVDDLQEQPYLSPLKTLRLLKWFSQSLCANSTKFLVKVDDDVFLNLPNLLSHIESVPNAWVNYMGGQLILDDSVDRNPYSENFVPRGWWKEGYYPPYLASSLMVFSAEVVPKLVSASAEVPLFHLEGPFITGMIGFDKLGLVPSDIPGIVISSPKWLIRLKMALISTDFSKMYVAFRCRDDVAFIKELYYRLIGPE